MTLVEVSTTMVAMTSGRKRLIVIVGPTGSGKTDLSIAVAEHFAAPIISTDSRQFYRGMAIGTAQPSREQMERVEHHLVDCLDVSEEFNCGAYERVALERLSELFAKHDTVVAVGGSGLYIKSLCEGMDDLPDVEPALREELLKTYLDALRQYMPVDETYFRQQLRHFVLFRTLQVLGAYGFRGYFEKKPHFLQSVPFAIDNLRRLLREPFKEYPYLSQILTELTQMRQFYDMTPERKLPVKIYSFAYKKGIPNDMTGNGGGYVFDCRAINNPGKYEHYKHFTGLDKEVIKFLEDDGEVFKFLDNACELVDAHVQRFIERKFTNLMVSFGCTGGQHRSVYCAERLAEHLNKKFDIKIKIIHREQDIEKEL